MSNPWAQSFEDLRSPYLQEKKAKKDYDGDGKIESGAKEYRGVVHNKIQKAKGGKADGQDTSSVKEEKRDSYKPFGKFGKVMGDARKKVPNAIKKVKEHHQKDADGNPIEHGDGTPASLDERKSQEGGRSEFGKASVRNMRRFGYGGNNASRIGQPEKRGEAIKKRKAEHKAGRGVKGSTQEREKKMKPVNWSDKNNNDNRTEEFTAEAKDKKGSGSGTKDACYHKVKSRYSVWPSAYASGALVKCRKVGAKNWGNSSKKEEFDYYQMPMKSFGDMVGECWKTHKKVGMKMKGGKMVPDCRPKNESVEEAVKNPKLDIKETGVKNKIEINPEIKTEAAKAPVKK